MSDDTERSVASAGSVAGEFVGRARAWRDERGYPTAGEMLDEAVAVIASLRLTDAEREAVERLCEATNDMIDDDKRAGGCHWQDDAAAVAVVRGLLERTK